MEEDLAGVVRAARNTAANYGRPNGREAPALALFVFDEYIMNKYVCSYKF